MTTCLVAPVLSVCSSAAARSPSSVQPLSEVITVRQPLATLKHSQRLSHQASHNSMTCSTCNWDLGFLWLRLYWTSTYHWFCIVRRNGDLLVFWGRGHRRGVRASTLIGELQPQFVHLLHVSHCGHRRNQERWDGQHMFGNGKAGLLAES